MLISSNTILDKARKGGFAFPHFNYWDDLSIKAELTAAENKKLPVILAWAQKHGPQISIEEAINLGRFYGSRAKVPVVLHLDHGTDPELVKWGASHGFSSVMIDASNESFDDNVRITKDVVEYCHQRGVVVEAEVGHVGSNASEDNTTYTEVAAAIEFVQKTAVDSLAVSIGTLHGVYKMGKPKLNFERIKELRDSIKVPRVCHGGSSSGDANLTQAAKHGIAKVNIYTDLANAALKVASERKYAAQFDLLAAQKAAIEGLSEHYYDVFDTKKFEY